MVMKTIILLSVFVLLGFSVIAAIDRVKVKDTVSTALSSLFKEDIQSENISIVSEKSTKANIISDHPMIDFKYKGTTVSIIQSKNAK